MFCCRSMSMFIVFKALLNSFKFKLNLIKKVSWRSGVIL